MWPLLSAPGMHLRLWFTLVAVLIILAILGGAALVVAALCWSLAQMPPPVIGFLFMAVAVYWLTWVYRAPRRA